MLHILYQKPHYHPPYGKIKTDMARLPNPGGDVGNWGVILNDFLNQAHTSGGLLKPITQSTVVGLEADLAARPLKANEYLNALDFGAVGDGVTDNTLALQAMLNAGPHVFIPKGTFILSSALQVKFHNAHIVMTPDTILKAAVGFTSSYMLISQNYNGIIIDGHNAQIDLNDAVNRAIIITTATGSGLFADYVQINDLRVSNRPVVTTNKQAAITLVRTRMPILTNIAITNYGYNNALGVEAYMLSITQSEQVKVQGLNLTNGYIGVGLDSTTDVQISNFSIVTMKDNGIYPLASAVHCTFTDGYINGVQEGIVMLSGYVHIINVRFLNCTNKGISARRAYYGKVINCHFEGNALAIGDNDATASTHLLISQCTFINNGSSTNTILLNRLNHSDITDCHFYETVASSSVIRINYRTGAESGGLGVRILRNNFQLVGKVPTYAVRIASANNCEVSHNTFVEANTAINLFTATSAPTGTIVAYNVYRDVTTTYLASGGVSATVLNYS